MLQQQRQNLDLAIAAVNLQLSSYTTLQSTASEVPEVISYAIGDKTTTFVGPDRLAKAIGTLTDALMKLMDRRDKLTRGMKSGIRRAGIAR